MSGMRMTYDVEYADGRKVRTVAMPADIVRFERTYVMPFTEMSTLEHVFFLAWAPLNREGQELLPFEDFLKILAGVTPVDDEEDAKSDVPLDEAPSAEPSPA